MNDATGPGLTDELLEDCLQAVYRTVIQGRAAEVDEIAAFARVFLSALDPLRAEWMPVTTAKCKLLKGQVGFVDRLVVQLQEAPGRGSSQGM